jgi:hypothetical protein
MKSGGDLNISDGVAQVNDDSHDHHILVSYGNHNEAASGATGNAPTTGMMITDHSCMYMTQSYKDTTAPTNYGNIINVAGQGTGQLFLGWSGENNKLERLYYRSHRDNNESGWSKWGSLAYLSDFSWIVIRDDGTRGASGSYPMDVDWAELLFVLRYTDTNQIEFHNIPCPGGRAWPVTHGFGIYIGKANPNDANYGVQLNTTGGFTAKSLTAVYIYGRRTLL